MGVTFHCDYCNKQTNPEHLRKLVALMPLVSFKNAAVVEELHSGELCLNCIEAIRATLPQNDKSSEGGYGG